MIIEGSKRVCKIPSNWQVKYLNEVPEVNAGHNMIR